MVGLGDPMAAGGLRRGTACDAEEDHRGPLLLRLLIVRAAERVVVRDFAVDIQDDDGRVMEPHEVETLPRLGGLPRPYTPSLKSVDNTSRQSAEGSTIRTLEPGSADASDLNSHLLVRFGGRSGV